MRDVVEIGLGKTAQRGLPPGRHRHRAEPAYPGRRRRLHRLAARRLPVRDPLRRAPVGRHDEPGHRRCALGQLGGLGVLNVEGLWTPLRGPDEGAGGAGRLDEEAAATRRLQEVYAEPIRPELIAERVGRSATAASPSRVRVSPQHTLALAPVILDAGVDILVIQGTHRLGRARVHSGRAAEPQGVHRRPRPAGDRRRLHRLQDRAAPDAYRRGRRDRRRRRRRLVDHRHGAGHPGADGHRDRRRRRRPPRLPGRDRRPVRAPDRRRRPARPPATSPRRSAAAPTR